MAKKTYGPVYEPCREWVDEIYNNCPEMADVIIWGKLFPKEALGPKCMFHAGKYIRTDNHSLSQMAVFDLRKVRPV